MDLPIIMYKKSLACVISAILTEIGFDSADKESLETLTEMLQSFIANICDLTKNFCEFSGRVEPLVIDIILSFVEIGFNYNNLPSYLKNKHIVLPPMQPQQPQKQLNMLQAGSKQSLPPHIPPHFPQFPDSHAYVRTPTHKQPIIDYESVREKAAIQKRDIEKALTKFSAKINPCHNLFDNEESNIFPLIAIKPPYPPYLSALLPQDQIFDQEDLEHDHKSQMMQQAKEQKENSEKNDEENQEENNNVNKNEDNTSITIDNPYLAATKLPKKEEMEVS